MATIIEQDKAGLPTGSYTVTYYRLRGGRIQREAGGDSYVSSQYVERVAKNLRDDEVIEAQCESQPGGLTAYGSYEAKGAMGRYREQTSKD